jgi:formylglycine-generating enzyme required for sulfatase activity
MTEAKRPLKVFLCHAHSDKDAVKALYSRLTKDGVDAWLDKEKLLPGQDWELEIRKAVREADVVVVCLSKQFNQAGFRQKEVRLALDTAMEKPEGEIFIIPARWEECDNLESLRKWHWVDLFEENGYEKLMRALRARAETIGAEVKVIPVKKHPRLPHTNPSGNSTPYYIQKIDEKKKNLHSASAQNVKHFGEQDVILPTHSKLKTKSPKLKTEYVIAFIGAAATIIAGLLSSPWIEKWFSPSPIATELATGIFTLTVQPTVLSRTPEPKITLTETASLPLETIDIQSVPMRLVTGGKFVMGDTTEKALIYCQKYRNDCQSIWFIDETPPHSIDLNTFYIDKFEVTNKLYKNCVDSSVCLKPKNTSSYTHSDYYVNSKYDNYPVLYVNWEMAKTFCEWREARLPTEAEWEKAARGNDERTYPWGENIDCNIANYWGENKACPGDTASVDSFESGKSIYGVYNMAGNVAEWVEDWYQSDYYSTLKIDFLNPLGPQSGQDKTFRGGSWNSLGNFVRTTSRFSKDLTYTSDGIGFRCAKDANP